MIDKTKVLDALQTGTVIFLVLSASMCMLMCTGLDCVVIWGLFELLGITEIIGAM